MASLFCRNASVVDVLNGHKHAPVKNNIDSQEISLKDSCKRFLEC